MNKQNLQKINKIYLGNLKSSKDLSTHLENIVSNPHDHTRNMLPAELLILNRYGVGYPYLKTAWEISKKYKITPFEVLIKGKVISLETWLDSQQHLADERQRAYAKRQQEALLLKQSISNLAATLPHYSAQHTFTNWQIIFFVLSMLVVSVIAYFDHSRLIFIIGMLLTLFYMASTFLRGLVLASFQPAAAPSKALITQNDNDLPIYTVLVALYKEANQVGALTQSLWQLDWPKHKLDIKLICEADDRETVKAIVDANLPSCFELVQVPYSTPRTKPKALNYALPLCKGDYLVLYDAEDRPSAGQLREAFLKFEKNEDALACLQAPLHIHNGKQNWLTAMFAIEYVTLFNGILPVLEKWRVPIPLGGTSNHFKTEILKNIGAWDPYNVTEDADLGIRLFREGYRCGTISLPTYEEAPPKLWPWIKQRTRWLKGWMQTVLVHSRNPVHALSDLGLKSTLAFHLLLTSILISSLIHPFF